MACTPPYKCGTGGWCGCNCGCCVLCPCYTQVVYTIKIKSFPDAPTEFCYTGVDYTRDITVSYTGCCLYSPQLYDIGNAFFTTMGAGTLTIDPAAIDDFSCSKGGKCTYTTCLTLPDSYDPAFYQFNTEEPFSIELEDCTEIIWTIGCASFCEPCCYVENNVTTVATLLPDCEVASMRVDNRFKKQLMKNSILSRIKKVHYKP